MLFLILLTAAAAFAPFGFAIGRSLGRRSTSAIRPMHRSMR